VVILWNFELSGPRARRPAWAESAGQASGLSKDIGAVGDGPC